MPDDIHVYACICPDIFWLEIKPQSYLHVPVVSLPPNLLFSSPSLSLGGLMEWFWWSAQAGESRRWAVLIELSLCLVTAVRRGETAGSEFEQHSGSLNQINSARLNKTQTCRPRTSGSLLSTASHISTRDWSMGEYKPQLIPVVSHSKELFFFSLFFGFRKISTLGFIFLCVCGWQLYNIYVRRELLCPYLFLSLFCSYWVYHPPAPLG